MLKEVITQVFYPNAYAEDSRRLHQLKHDAMDEQELPLEADNDLGKQVLNENRTTREHIVTRAAEAYWRNELELNQALTLMRARQESEEVAVEPVQTPLEAIEERIANQPEENSSHMAWLTAEAENADERLELARDTSCPIAVLELLTRDSSARVARAASKNLRAQLSSDFGIATGNLSGPRADHSYEFEWLKRKAV
jgi:hypothetical protein